jgi:hypothetical protein
MTSCPMSVAWSRLILSLCCTKYGSSRDVVLSGRITSIAMSKSGQLGRHCTVGTHCRCLHVCRRLHERSLKIREPSCVPSAAKPFFIPVVHIPPGGRGTRGNIGAPLLGRQSPELWDKLQHWSSPLRKAEPGAAGHVIGPKLTSARR